MRAGHIAPDGTIEIVPASAVVGEATDAAYERATAWVAARSAPSAGDST